MVIVRFSRVWRAVWRMRHPLVRWLLQMMTQDGGMTAQFQGDHEGFGASPLNWVECGICRGQILLAQQQLVAAEAALTEAEQLLTPHSDPSNFCLLYDARLQIAVQHQDLDQMLRHANRLKEAAEESGESYLQLLATMYRAVIDANRGQTTVALESLDRAIRDAERWGVLWLVPRLVVTRADITMHMGQISVAETWFADAQLRAEQMGDDSTAGIAMKNRAMLQHRQGHHGQARDMAMAALIKLRRQAPLHRLSAHLDCAAIFLEQDEPQ
jgi:ATP/maltotriose-dependent transcriptional regulator MalT